MGSNNVKYSFSRKSLEDTVLSIFDSKFDPKTFSFKSKWKSDHAEFYYFTMKKDGKIIPLIAKKYIHLAKPHEAMYTMAHQPDLLFPKEKRNLENISTILSDSLTPTIYGSSQKNKMLIINNLGSQNMKKELQKATRCKDRSKMDEKFLNGVENIARFNGLCNANETQFNNAHDYKVDLAMFQKASLSLLKENMVRFFHVNNSRVRKNISVYDYDTVNDYLKLKKGLDVESRLNEINQMNSSLNEQLKLRHNDCNGLNMIGNKLIDLEKFGYGSWTNDISSYCIIVGLGKNDVHKNFSRSRERYLCYEDAYEKGNQDLIEKVSNMGNGDYNHHLKTIMSDQERADWTLSFFARAIDKLIQLEGSYDRYKVNDNASIDNSQINNNGNLKNIMNLFSAVRYSDLIKECTNEKGVRRYFNNYGNLINDLEIYTGNNKIDFEDILEGIKY